MPSGPESGLGSRQTQHRMTVTRVARKRVLLVPLIVMLNWVDLAEGQQPRVSSSAVTDPHLASVQPETCGLCHREEYATWSVSPHARINGKLYRSPDKTGCEACHGPGRDHAQSGNKSLIIRFTGSSPELVEQACLKCHERGMRLYWRGSPHESRNVTCTTCHTLHAKPVMTEHLARLQERPRETVLLAKQTAMEVCLGCHLKRRAQLLRSSHMPFREGQITCTDCHNPHGTATPGLLIENSVNENCYKCHAEKRGPFLWEHAPVAENCLTCHEAHGSVHRYMLRSSVPRLCQRCHIRGGHQSQPREARNRLIFNMGCTNCHSQIHGSNHPSGVRFHR